MENNRQPNGSGNFYKAVSLTVIVLFLALLLTPLALLIFTGEDKAVLEGEKQYEAPDFSAREFLSAEFQNKFELWFSTKYPLRSNFVAAYRQIEFDTSDIGFDISTVFIPKAKPAESVTYQTDNETAEAEAESVTSPYRDFNELYAEINRRLYERKLLPVEPAGYKGNDAVVIGKSGYCFERAYINDLYGYSEPYTTCTDEFLEDRAEKLEYIQKRLEEMGVAFYLIITPSKAAAYEEFIPDWYKAQNIAAADYVRPIERLLPKLDEHGIRYTFTPDYFAGIGLDETFPLTGIHWNKLAAAEACKLLLEKYTEQTGEEVRYISVDGVTEQQIPSGFGNPEDDIYNIAYSGVSTENSIKDEFYYIPQLSISNEECTNKINIFISGGSFCWDITHYMRTGDLKITKRFYQFFYQTWQGNADSDPLLEGGLGRRNWKALLDDVDYVIFESNEQQAATMGEGIYDSLYEYLLKTEN